MRYLGLVLLLVCTTAHGVVVKGRGKGKPFLSGKAPAVFVNTYAFVMDTAERIATTSTPWTDNYSNLTVSFWHKNDGTPLVNRIMIGKSASREFEIKNGASDATALRFIVGASTSNYCESTAGTITSSWKHFVVIFIGGGAGNATRCYIYANGVDVTSTYGGTIPSSIAGSTGQYSVNSANGANNAEGTYDEVAVWRLNLTSSVSTLYNNGKPANLASLNPIVWWRMGDLTGDSSATVLNGGGGTIHDASGNGWDGTTYTTDPTDIVADVP